MKEKEIICAYAVLMQYYSSIKDFKKLDVICNFYDEMMKGE